MDLALIGNCQYQALIDSTAAVRWLCWPRFDSSFVFGSLLDEEKGGEFSVQPTEQEFEAKQSYLPHTNIVRTRFTTANGKFEVLDFAPRFRQFNRSFKPTMLVRQVRRLGGAPNIRVRCRPVYDYGRVEPGSYMASNHIQWMLPNAQLRLTTNAPLSYVDEGSGFALDDDVFLVLTWGQPLEAPLEETCRSFLARTKSYWEQWAKHCNLPDHHQEAVIRSALTLKLHQFEDTGAITAATTTSVPEYPGSGRNWDYRFCWLRDSCFTLGALRRLGQFEEMEGFMRYLHNIAERSPDRLQPVYGITGETALHEVELDHLSGYRGDGPVRAGNDAYRQVQHDVYGEMIAAIAPMFVDVRFKQATSDRSTRLLHKLLDHVDREMEAPDAGLWEKRAEPRLYTFSLLMHWTGAYAAEIIGTRLADPALRRRGADLRARAEALIDGAWREEAGFYADSPETSDADAALFMMVNVGLLGPHHPQGLRHVRALADALSASDHLFYRYLHDDGLGATHATFTVCGFWYAEALARLGLRDEAREVFSHLLAHTNHLGLLSEDIDPETGALWGNFPQTYSHVGLINAAFAIAPPTGPIV